MARNILLASLLKNYISRAGTYLLRYRYPLTAVIGRHIPDDLSTELAKQTITPQVLDERLREILTTDLEFKVEVQHLRPAQRLRLGSDRRGISGVDYSIPPRPTQVGVP